MFQKCSFLRVLEVFFVEPTKIHFVKEISKRIGLAPTSVRNHIKVLLKDGLIRKKRARPFDGFVANRDNDDFVFYKRVYSLYSLKDLTEFLVSSYYPTSVIIFGSYSVGEDVENSDIDIVVVTKTKKEVSFAKFEKKLKRSVHPIIIERLDELDKNIRKKVLNGIVMYGGL